MFALFLNLSVYTVYTCSTYRPDRLILLSQIRQIVIAVIVFSHMLVKLRTGEKSSTVINF